MVKTAKSSKNGPKMAVPNFAILTVDVSSKDWIKFEETFSKGFLEILMVLW